MGMVRREGSRLIIRPKADFNRVGKLFAALGALGCLALVPLLSKHIAYVAALVFPGIFLILGLIFAAIGRSIVLDTAAGTLEHRGQKQPLASFGAVHMGTHIQTVRTEHGRQQSQRWTVGLFRTGSSERAAEIIQRVRESIDRVAAGEASEMSPAELDQMRADLGAVRQLVSEGSLPLAEHGDEAKVWRAGEAIAKALDVPLIDMCGDEVVERTPAELDMALSTRIQRGLHIPEPPGPLPERVSVQPSDELIIDFQHDRWVQVILIVVFGLSLVGAGVALGLASGWIFGALMIAPGVGCLALLPLAGRGHGHNQVRVSGDQIIYESRFLGRKRSEMRLSELEMVRANTLLHSSLNLMSDAKVVRVPMSPEQARWMRRRIEQHLA